MSSAEMLQWLLRLTSVVLRSSTISLSILGGLVKVTWSFCGIKPRNAWGQEILIPCGMVLTWLNMSQRKAPMSQLIMKGQPWRSLEMGSILKNTMHNPQPRLFVVYYCTAFLHSQVVFIVIGFVISFHFYGRCHRSLPLSQDLWMGQAVTLNTQPQLLG